MPELYNIHSSLVAWFKINQRTLPWRDPYKPYHTWISEIMLQQTRVETVITYFQRWIKALPTIESLANAEEELVLKLWEGLGYYSRARNLKKAAIKIIEQHQGNLPEDRKELESLPGIGSYTSGAIASIAFNQAEEIIDGNVRRVFSRLFDWEKEISIQASNQFFQAKGKQLVSFGEPRIINQAIMELGALICKPKNPDCSSCPVENLCLSKQNQTIAERPNKAKKVSNLPLYATWLIIQRGDQFYLEKQQKGNWWSSMWCFPYQKSENKPTSFQESATEFLQEYQIKNAELKRFPDFKHAITKYKVTAQPFLIQIPENQTISELDNSNWFSFQELETISLPKPAKIICKYLGNLVQNQALLEK